MQRVALRTAQASVPAVCCARQPPAQQPVPSLAACLGMQSAQRCLCRHLFKVEQETYEAEGIDWAHVDFEDNQICVDLLEARPPKGTGILSLFDEECRFTRGGP